MKKILVPCDFSPPSQEAFKFAANIAQQSNGEVHVLYILDITFLRGNPTLSYAYAFNVSFLHDMEKESEENFSVMRRKYSNVTTTVKFKHIVGSILPGIENYIREQSIDLVVMGTHGQGDAKWGSNTERIVRHSPVPVFAIRSEPARKIKTIVAPITPGQVDKSFCKKLKDMHAFFKASLHLVWINTPNIFKNDSEANKDLLEFATDAHFSDYSINVRSDYNVEEGIYHFAKEVDADVIAIGTHAWKGLTHFFTGSVAEDLVNHVNIPIWTCARD